MVHNAEISKPAATTNEVTETVGNKNNSNLKNDNQMDDNDHDMNKSSQDGDGQEKSDSDSENEWRENLIFQWTQSTQKH